MGHSLSSHPVFLLASPARMSYFHVGQELSKPEYASTRPEPPFFAQAVCHRIGKSIALMPRTGETGFHSFGLFRLRAVLQAGGPVFQD